MKSIFHEVKTNSSKYPFPISILGAQSLSKPEYARLTFSTAMPHVSPLPAVTIESGARHSYSPNNKKHHHHNSHMLGGGGEMGTRGGEGRLGEGVVNSVKSRFHLFLEMFRCSGAPSARNL